MHPYVFGLLLYLRRLAKLRRMGLLTGRQKLAAIAISAAVGIYLLYYISQNYNKGTYYNRGKHKKGRRKPNRNYDFAILSPVTDHNRQRRTPILRGQTTSSGDDTDTSVESYVYPTIRFKEDNSTATDLTRMVSLRGLVSKPDQSLQKAAEIRSERDKYDISGVSDLLLESFDTEAEMQLVVKLRSKKKLIHSLVAALHQTILGHVATTEVFISGRLLKSNKSDDSRSKKRSKRAKELKSKASVEKRMRHQKQLVGLSIAPLCVHKEYRKKGVGSRLIVTLLDNIRRDEQFAELYSYVVVLGDPQYYKRFGFRPAREFGLRCKWDLGEEHQDAFQIIMLDKTRLLSFLSSLEIDENESMITVHHLVEFDDAMEH